MPIAGGGEDKMFVDKSSGTSRAPSPRSPTPRTSSKSCSCKSGKVFELSGFKRLVGLVSTVLMAVGS